MSVEAIKYSLDTKDPSIERMFCALEDDPKALIEQHKTDIWLVYRSGLLVGYFMLPINASKAITLKMKKAYSACPLALRSIIKLATLIACYDLYKSNDLKNIEFLVDHAAFTAAAKSVYPYVHTLPLTPSSYILKVAKEEKGEMYLRKNGDKLADISDDGSTVELLI